MTYLTNFGSRTPVICLDCIHQHYSANFGAATLGASSGYEPACEVAYSHNFNPTRRADYLNEITETVIWHFLPSESRMKSNKPTRTDKPSKLIESLPNKPAGCQRAVASPAP